jgi:phosphoserine phosphatase
MLGLHPQVNEIPFEPEHRFAATYHADEDGIRVFVKGAPERVLEMCDLGTRSMQAQQAVAQHMAEQGFRVLAFARGRIANDLDAARVPSEPDRLVLIGFVGMIDPLRPGAREAMTACNRAGIAVSMVTGDHPVTALAIARDLGLAERAEQVISGLDLERMNPDELTGAIGRTRVFARVAPRQKLDIVEAARRAGHFVAVTGDGINDASALRAANIGVAMGKAGTDVAREAAELVISDDNFSTIVAGVEEGRIALEGLVMGTRSGDLDPTVVSYLARAEGVSPDDVVSWLNQRSGLLGVSGSSNDMRDLIRRGEAGDHRAQLALDMFCYCTRKYIGAYLAALDGDAAVVFSGGIGEHAAAVRRQTCSGLDRLGFELDQKRNAKTVGVEGRITTDSSRLLGYVIPTDEEIMIGRETVRCLRGASERDRRRPRS